MFRQALGINNRRQVVGEFIDATAATAASCGSGGVSRSSTYRTRPAAPWSTSTTTATWSASTAPTWAWPRSAASSSGTAASSPSISRAAPIPFLTDINNRGQIAGTTIRDPADPSTFRGFLLARGPGGPLTTIRPPDSTASFVGGLNDRGQLCGTADNPDAAGQPAMGMMTMMGVAG